MKGSQAVAEVLRREGVDTVFCFPANKMIDTAAAVGIRPIVGRQERSVINMADAYSRTSNGNRIGIAMVQHGPGAEHAFGGVAQAYADSVPLLLLPNGNTLGELGLRTTFDAVVLDGADGARADAPGVPADAIGPPRPGRTGVAARCRRGGVRRGPVRVLTAGAVPQRSRPA